MDKKQMYVQVVNLTEGKVFSLPTLYTDRTEACVCGQNYVRDRQAENKQDMIFFRILDAKDGRVAQPYNLQDNEIEEPFQTQAEENAMKMVMALTDFICEHCTVNV